MHTFIVIDIKVDKFNEHKMSIALFFVVVFIAVFSIVNFFVILFQQSLLSRCMFCSTFSSNPISTSKKKNSMASSPAIPVRVSDLSVSFLYCILLLFAFLILVNTSLFLKPPKKEKYTVKRSAKWKSQKRLIFVLVYWSFPPVVISSESHQTRYC